MVGQQRQIGVQIGSEGLSIPFRHPAVQLLALGVQHQAVGHVPGYGVFEGVGKIRQRSHDFHYFQPRQGIHEVGNLGKILGNGVDILDQAEGETPADDAGNLDDKLLGGRQPVEAARHDTFDGVGQAQLPPVFLSDRALYTPIGNP